jgi:hypothetical protein
MLRKICLTVFAMGTGVLMPAAAQDFHWVPVSPTAPGVFYSVSDTDKKNNTVSVAVAFMRRAANPGDANGSGSMRTEIILCGHNGYEDTHQDVKGVFHPAPASFEAFDFNKPGVMEFISRAVCPKG